MSPTIAWPRRRLSSYRPGGSRRGASSTWLASWPWVDPQIPSLARDPAYGNGYEHGYTPCWRRGQEVHAPTLPLTLALFPGHLAHLPRTLSTTLYLLQERQITPLSILWWPSSRPRHRSRLFLFDRLMSPSLHMSSSHRIWGGHRLGERDSSALRNWGRLDRLRPPGTRPKLRPRNLPTVMEEDG